MFYSQLSYSLITKFSTLTKTNQYMVVFLMQTIVSNIFIQILIA